MTALDYVVLAVVAAILGLAAWYIVRSKKKGTKCVGCPNGCCSTQNSCPGCNGCGNNNDPA